MSLNDLLDNAEKPERTTLILPDIQPSGTVTVKLVVVAAVTVAFTLPKYTMLFAGVASKFVP